MRSKLKWQPHLFLNFGYQDTEKAILKPYQRACFPAAHGLKDGSKIAAQTCQLNLGTGTALFETSAFLALLSGINNAISSGNTVILPSIAHEYQTKR